MAKKSKPAKRPAPKKTVAKKPAVKKAVKKAAAKKAVVKKTTPKKVVAKKPAVKKTVKKVVPKKTASKKAIAKKAITKKPAIKKAAAKKVTPKKIIVKKAIVKKAIAKKVITKKKVIIEVVPAAAVVKNEPAPLQKTIPPVIPVEIPLPPIPALSSPDDLVGKAANIETDRPQMMVPGDGLNEAPLNTENPATAFDKNLFNRVMAKGDPHSNMQFSSKPKNTVKPSGKKALWRK